MKPAPSVDHPVLQDQTLQAIFAALGDDNALMVGGIVRAAVLGEPAGDIDIATRLTPDRVTAALNEAGFKVLPTGIDHGTVTAIADHRGFEITTLRRDVATDGRRATVAFTDDWVEDARRRDFTMNTLLMDMQGRVYDPLGDGVADLKAGIVRFVGDPQTRIQEDALRILRFYRFHARYGQGAPAAAGHLACVHNRHLIENLSRERVTTEIEKLMLAAHASASVVAMADAGILEGFWQKNIHEAAYETMRRAVLSAGLSCPDMALLAYSVHENKADVLNAKIKKFLILSNRKKDFLIKFIGFTSDQSDSIKKNLYLFGSDVTRAGTILSSIISNKDIDLQAVEFLVEQVKNTTEPVFPVTAGLLMTALGMKPGVALGQVLKKTEAWWLAGDAVADQQQCLDYAKTILK